MAFQPIVDARDHSIYAYEALVRSEDGGGAAGVIARLRPEQLYRFDQTCRVKAIATAARLGLTQRLSINFFPNAVYEPATCIRSPWPCEAVRLPVRPPDLEATESSRCATSHMTRISALPSRAS